MPARGQFTLFHVRGIRIGVDWSWFLVLFLIIFWLSGFYREVLGADEGEVGPYALAVASAFAFFGSILLHELGHALVARRNGIGTSEIALWLFGGVARLDRDSSTPGVEFRVAAAGPAVTVLIAAACVGVGVGFEGSAFWDAMLVRDDADTSGLLALIAWLASINMLILAFNLIPAYPLDGGRIARAIAWRVTGDRSRATRFAALVGSGFAWTFIAIGILLILSSSDLFITGLWLALVGWILGGAARGALVQSEVSRRLGNLTVADLMDAEPVAINEDTPIQQALDEFFLRYRWPWFPVVDAAQRFVGILKLGAAEAVPEDRRDYARVSEAVDTDGTSTMQIGADQPVEALLGSEQLRALGALPAVDSSGRLRGIVTIDALARALRSSG
jgi:Zn-dependent protease